MLWRPLLHITRSGVRQCYRLGKRKSSTWADDVARPSNNVQIYTSITDDPYLNLSIEHYLLRNTPQHSTVLFLYSNRPCIVIGRNQNPWLEVNLNILNVPEDTNALETAPPGLGKVDLVRRRSGGGTVFHDHGNVNWTVICPTKQFTRDKHGEMIVRALRSRGVERARLNRRHDIVLDQGVKRTTIAYEDLHQTPWTPPTKAARSTIKVSGSAYKLTQGRALHHGTCLLSSPNLEVIPQYLHSPAKSFIKAMGVDSVSSPVGNIGLSRDVFHEAVVDEFSKMYINDELQIAKVFVGDEALQVYDIERSWCAFQTSGWMFGKTPGFTFETHPTKDNKPLQSNPVSSMPPFLRMYLEFRDCRVINGSMSLSAEKEGAENESERLLEAINGKRLHFNWNWHEILKSSNPNSDTKRIDDASQWLQQMLPSMLGRYLPFENEYSPDMPP